MKQPGDYPDSQIKKYYSCFGASVKQAGNHLLPAQLHLAHIPQGYPEGWLVANPEHQGPLLNCGTSPIAPADGQSLLLFRSHRCNSSALFIMVI